MPWLSESFPVLALIKMGAAVLMVVVLAYLAEVVSTRFAGILSGYPLGSALSLFFFGYEISPQFAAESAHYTCLGLIATQTFAFSYYQASLMVQRQSKPLQILCATLGGLAGYFFAAAILLSLRVSFLAALLLPILAIAVFNHLFRNTENTKIQTRLPTNRKVLLLRATFAACIIVLITFIADSVGPGWAGMFAAFPMTMLPLLVIIHFSYDPEHVHTVLKNIPKGLGAVVAYSLAVILCYPVCGIYVGTVIAYGLATLYLVLIHAGELVRRVRNG
jgi:hypothetical protein